MRNRQRCQGCLTCLQQWAGELMLALTGFGRAGEVWWRVDTEEGRHVG